MDYLEGVNPALYLLLKQRTNWGTKHQMDVDEVIVIFMETIAEGKFNLRSKKNKGVGALMGYLFSKGMQKATESDVGFDFESETDVITFITELAKKIKAGTLDPKSQKSIRKSRLE